jgi:hypothetical protein
VKPWTEISIAGKAVAVAATVALAAACGSSSPKAGPPATAAVTVTTTRSTSTTSTSAPAPALPVFARIELPSSTLVAGSTERGTLVIENGTRAPLRLTTGGTLACKPGWTVILTNQQLPQEAAFPSSCDALPMVVRVGETRLPFTLRSDYQACSESGRAQDALTPMCVKDATGLDTSPPLPPGEYRATFFSNIAGFIPVESVPVRVARP